MRLLTTECGHKVAKKMIEAGLDPLVENAGEDLSSVIAWWYPPDKY